MRAEHLLLFIMSPLIILHLLLLLEHCEAQVAYLEGLSTMEACLSLVFSLASQYLGW